MSIGGGAAPARFSYFHNQQRGLGPVRRPLRRLLPGASPSLIAKRPAWACLLHGIALVVQAPGHFLSPRPAPSPLSAAGSHCCPLLLAPAAFVLLLVPALVAGTGLTERQVWRMSHAYQVQTGGIWALELGAARFGGVGVPVHGGPRRRRPKERNPVLRLAGGRRRGRPEQGRGAPGVAVLPGAAAPGCWQGRGNGGWMGALLSSSTLTDAGDGSAGPQRPPRPTGPAGGVASPR